MRAQNLTHSKIERLFARRWRAALKDLAPLLPADGDTVNEQQLLQRNGLKASVGRIAVLRISLRLALPFKLGADERTLKSNSSPCRIIAICYILHMGAVTYTKKVLKGLRKMPRHHADSLRSALERIAGGDSQGLDIKALQGRQGFRLRSGNYRAIYEIDGEQINVLVLDAGPRGDIYK